MADKINQDEISFISMLIDNESNNIKGQLEWCRKYEPEKISHINTKEVYIKRLNLLKVKLNDVLLGGISE